LEPAWSQAVQPEFIGGEFYLGFGHFARAAA